MQYDGDSTLIDPTSEVPHVLWDIDPLSMWGESLPLHKLSSLKYERNHRSSPVIRNDAWLLGNNGDRARVNMSLLDTGSTTFSFISPTLAAELQHLFPIQLLSSPTCVKLGDNKTKKVLDKYIIAPLCFSHNNREHRGTIQFYVFDSGYDLIVGMPDILQYFATFVCAQILSQAPSMSNEDLVYFMSTIAKNSYELMDEVVIPERRRVVDLHNDSGESTVHSFDSELNYAPHEDDLLRPWSEPVKLSSPEDEFDRDPALHYLSKPHEDHVRNFYASIETHTENKSFLELPSVREALMTDKYLQVFCPKRWTGINPSACPDVLPIELEMLPNLPTSLSIQSPHIPHRLVPYFEPEWARQTSYMWVPHSGPYACALLALPKWNPDGTATCRVAGDFRPINVFIKRYQETTEDPHRVATEISKFRYKADWDCRNGFHGMPLSERSSNFLAVHAPNGQYRPLFMPEGLGPATSIYQRVMRSIFKDFLEEKWFFVIIDNISFGADTFEELAQRMVRVLERCKEANLTLKFEKSFHCQNTVKFFGFEIGHNFTRMDDSRIKSVLEIPLPTNVSEMRHFLGVSGFFVRFADHFSVLRAPLDDTLKESFDWKCVEKRENLRESFETFKKALADSCKLFRPNFTNPFLVRCDASIEGIGAVLLMLMPSDDPLFPNEWVPIAFASRKFSDQARRWSTWDQETFSIFYSVTVSFRQYLWGKKFVVENDHRNLQWLEASVVPKIVRWRLQLQEFDFLIRHIPGKQQVVADYFSRLHLIALDSIARVPVLSNVEKDDSCYLWDTSFSKDHQEDFKRSDPVKVMPFDDNYCQLCFVPELCLYTRGEGYVKPSDETQEAFDSVHNSRMGHHGAGRTYSLLHRKYPGHKISMEMVRDMVYDCPWCQKLREQSNRILKEQVHHLELTAFPSRGWVGVDILDMPVSDEGNRALVVFVVHDTKMVKLYAIKDAEAITVARCMYLFSGVGRYKGFTTDPGSNITADVINQLNEWMDTWHKVSLVDRHQSCGVERTNKTILEHTKALTQTERAVKMWDQPEYLQTVENIINRYSDWETGLSPNELTYGSEAMVYFQLLDPLKSVEDKHEYLRRLNEYLLVARTESQLFHKAILDKRARDNVDQDLQQEYQPGDFVLFKPNPRSRAHKLVPTLLGPYRVKSQERGEVFCHQVATGVARQFHITRLYPFTGSEEEAFELACRDSEQYMVRSILGYRGDPISARRYMTFLVEYADGDKSWVQYGPDIASNTMFQKYVDTIPELMLLKYTALEAGRYMSRAKKLSIPMTIAPRKFLMDLRALGFSWYDSLHLPQADTALYLVEVHFNEYLNKKRTRVAVDLPALGDRLDDLDYSWFELYATRLYLPDDAIFVDEAFLVQYPQILGATTERQKHLERLYSPVLAGTHANRRGIFRNGGEERPARENNVAETTRNSPRIQRDVHVPNVRDGNDVEDNRRGSPRLATEQTKILVRPISSRRFPKDIPVVNTGAREGLRRRTVVKKN